MPSCRLIVGDALFALAELHKGSIEADMIFGDPKYNIGIDYGSDIDDALSETEYCEWTGHWIEAARHCLKEGGAFWGLINEPNADMFGLWLTECVGPRVNRVIWRETFGQYKDTHFASGHRHLFYHIKCTDMYGMAIPRANFHRAKRTWNPDPIRVESQRMRAGDKRAAGPRVPDDVWEISRVQGNDGERQGWAPTQLRLWPVECAILCSTNPGDLVIDPYLGSGTTALAALAHGRSFIGIDINPDYVEKSIERIRGAGYTDPIRRDDMTPVHT